MKNKAKMLQLKQNPEIFTIPEIMQSVLTEYKLARHFAKFTPYKQYEFVEYIDDAKQEKTKLARIKKSFR